jgi:flagellar motor switch protein FliG
MGKNEKASAEIPPSTELPWEETLGDLPVLCTVELGRKTLLQKQIREIEGGAVLELDKLVNEPVDIYANNILVARAEVVVLDEKLGVRLTEIIGEDDDAEEETETVIAQESLSLNEHQESAINMAKEHPEDAAQLIRTWLYEEARKGEELTGRQKAAVFFVSAGTEISSEIYQYLREDEIETLTFEIARLESIGREQKGAILAEFQDLMAANEFNSFGGIDYSREVLEKSFGSQKAIDIITRLTSSLQTHPFDFIRRTDPAHLLDLIQQEHPQTIALILSYLEPNKAAVLLQNIPHEIQIEVARRIATLDRTAPYVIRDIERILEKKLSVVSSEDYVTAGGVESIVEILNLVDRSTKRYIIEDLEDEDPELAEEINKRMFVFEDIIMIDDRSMQKILMEVDSKDLAKALKSVDAVVQDKVFKNMSKNASVMLKEDMQYMGPVRLRDVEESQQKIVSVIRHLEDTGEIVVEANKEDGQIV